MPPVLSLASSSVPSALAALLLWIRAAAHLLRMDQGNPIADIARYLIFGQGEVTSVTREILRQAEPDRRQRPHVHVG